MEHANRQKGCLFYKFHTKIKTDCKTLDKIYKHFDKNASQFVNAHTARQELHSF